jgi:protein-tyrosine phosphatase
MSKIYWIQAECGERIGIMARPRGGDWLEDEIHAWLDAGANVIVSLLEPAEVRELELVAEQSLCLQSGLDFISFPIPDRGIPEGRSAMVQLINRLREAMLSGNGVAIHCRQGIGRSSMVAAIVLLSLGAGDNVFRTISAARGCDAPDTPEQANYALSFSSAE